MRQLEAIIAAVIVTGMVAVCMLLIGLNALLNPNVVQASNAPGSAAASGPVTSPASSPNDSSAQAQIRDLQTQVSQYQQQLDQANAQIQQYQQILRQLQQSGAIRITRDGRILVPAPSADGN